MMHNQTTRKRYKGLCNSLGSQKDWKDISYWFISIFSIIGLLGCTTPGQHFNDVANELGLYPYKLNSHQFQHILFENNILAGPSDTLHVYIDGDGTPWERNRWISDDPSARNPLILRLMIQDTMPSILLGRPCYYGLNNSPGCENKYWTSHRYSKEVIQSMSQALNIWLAKHKFTQIVLIGYSGGGSIAILMADKIKKTKKVVTIAANLDVKAWSKFHGYSKLKNSLNPSDEVKLKTGIQQFHFAGTDDNVVPPFIIKKYAENQKNSKYYQFDDKDHGCCWEEEWPNILGLIE
jgi:hypothetical protein